MAQVTVYWRPGCSFCWSLRRALQRAGVEAVERNIWDDADAAGFVRSATGGDETVPTVDIDGRVMVNPRPKQVLAALGLSQPSVLDRLLRRAN